MSDMYTESCDLFTMRYSLHPFTVDLVQIKCKSRQALPLSLEIAGKGNMLLYMLKGKASYKNRWPGPISLAAGNLLSFAQEREKHFLDLAPDESSFLIILLDYDYFKLIGKGITKLQAKAQAYTNRLPCCHLVKLHRESKKWIHQIMNFSHPNIGAIDGSLRMHAAFLLEHLSTEIKRQRSGIPFLIKDYLDAHYTEHGLSVRQVAAHFFLTERTLSNHFKRQFNTSVHRYYTTLRMQRAQYLVQAKGLLPRDIYYDLGYNDESAFRYAYGRFLRRIKDAEHTLC